MKVLLLLLVAGYATTAEGVISVISPKTVFDITTVYNILGEESSLENTDWSVVPKCYVGGTECSWESHGWNKSDSNYASAPFPLEGEIHKAKNEELTILRLTTKKFAISISSLNFNIYLMAEENIKISDMLLIRFDLDSSNNFAYRCLKTLAGNDVLRTMPDRRCTMLFNYESKNFEWDWNEAFNSLSIEIDKDVVTVVHANKHQVLFKMDLAKEFHEMADGAIKYVGIESYRQYKYSIPVDLLALSRRHGTLISPPVNPQPGATLVCLQMSIYGHPESGGSVAMSLKFENGTNLSVGKIGTSNEKVELWRFMTTFHATFHDVFRVHIEASKINTRPVVITGITNCNASGEFDNVLYDHQSPVEIHSRTNARGLPLLLPDGRVTSPEAGISQIPECTQNWQGCNNWVQSNFTRGHFKDGHSPLLDIGKFNDFVDLISKPKQKPMTKSRKFYDPIRFIFDVTRSIDWIYKFNIFLMDEMGDVATSDMYIIQLRDSKYYNPCIYKCTRNDNTQKVDIPGGTSRNCTTLRSYYFYNSFSENSRYVFELENASGRIVLKVDHSVVFDHIDPSPIATSRFALGSNDVDGYITGLPELAAFSLSQPTGSLASPPLPPNLDHVCVSLLFYAADGATIDLVLQEEDLETHVGSFLSAQPRQTGSCSHSNIIAQIPRKSRGEARLVVKATKLNDTELLIQRVAGCDGLAPEDLTVWKKKSTLTAFDVPRFLNYSTVISEVCPNGGLRYNKDECLCRPGFTGLNCSEGCGPNSYGVDCGGVCSESIHGCKGMVLCKPVIGCDCAPGFKGLFCATPCSTGEYGAGCRQRCGHCAEESCDIYTGECHHGCRNGHYPPFCHGLYAYITNSPKVSVNGFHEATVKANLEEFNEQGKPYFYQVQYKKFNETKWQMETPQLYSERIVTENNEDEQIDPTHKVGTLTGLEPATTYVARVVLIDTSLVSYQGDLVPVQSFTTPCTVPKEEDYLYYEMKQDSNEIGIELIGEEGFEVSWNISRGNVTWCDLIGYEIHVKADWRQVVYSVPSSDVTRKIVTGLSPGKEYAVKVRGVTSRGAAAFTRAQTATTAERAPDYVRRLTLAQAAERSLEVVWEEPRLMAGRIRRYQVNYRCVHLGACPDIDCGGSAGQMEVTATSAHLEGLLPYALYNISVAGISSSIGLSSSLQAVTSLGVPCVAPSADGTGIVSRTNSSFTVHWAAPESCRHLNGYLTGYRYELFSPGQLSPLSVGTTTNTTASFVGLVPQSDYIVRVVAANSAGWGTSHVLEIPAQTRATTPEVVEDLTVYKRGRRMLGLRWKPPRRTYGSLKSFTVTHRPLDGSHKQLGVTIGLSPCPAWPHLYCHTIKNLKADADYMVAVQARNTEVSEDGDEIAITATTKEGAPDAPSFLRVVNKTDTTMTIEWGLPDLVNGQLRSFLVNVEETDSHKSSDCCQYFPLREVIATDERLGFEFQMTGLKAASTYEVGVSAKTVSLGPAVSLTAHTRPRTPVLTHAPKLVEPAQVGKSLKIQVQPSVDDQGDIVRGYMLLLKAETTADESSPISDEWLSKELSRAINGSFSLAAEFNNMDIPKDGIVIMEAGLPLVDGVFGSVGINALVANTTYRPVWVLVFEYCNTLSMGYVLGDTFTVTEA